MNGSVIVSGNTALRALAPIHIVRAGQLPFLQNIAAIPNLLTFYDPLDLSTLFQTITGTTPVTSSGDPIGTITGLVNAVATGNDTTRPTYAPTGINGHPAIQFAGASSQKLTVNALAASLAGADSPYTMVAVAQVTTPGTNQNVFSAGRSSSATPFVNARGVSGSRWDSSRRDDASASISVTPNSPLIPTATGVVLAVRFFGTTVELWVNGARIVGPSAMDLGTLTLDRVTLGALGTNAYSQFMTGFLGRFVLFGRALTYSELAGVVNNFRAAYGI